MLIMEFLTRHAYDTHPPPAPASRTSCVRTRVVESIDAAHADAQGALGALVRLALESRDADIHEAGEDFTEAYGAELRALSPGGSAGEVAKCGRGR